MNHAVATVFEAFEYVQYTAWVGTALTVRLFAVWSSSAVLAFAAGSHTEMCMQILCSFCLFSHSVAPQHIMEEISPYSSLKMSKDA